MNAFDRIILSGFVANESGRFCSLWDIMQRLYAASTIAAVSNLARAITMVAAFRFAENGINKDTKGDRDAIKLQIEQSRMAISEIPLSRVLRMQFDRIFKTIDHAEIEDLIVMVREFHQNLVVELSAPMFLIIPPEKRDFYEQKTHPFGKKVAAAFPDARVDIAAASRCFALDEWTACVFHLMRVLEHGLRWLAAENGIPPDTTAHEQWKNVFDLIEKKIREHESLPKSAAKTDLITKASELAVQFRYFKDALA